MRLRSVPPPPEGRHGRLVFGLPDATLGTRLHLKPVSLDELFAIDFVCHKMLKYSH